MNTVDILKRISANSSEKEIYILEDELANPKLLPELLSIAEDKDQKYIIRGLASRYFTQYSLGAVKRLSGSDCKLARIGVMYGKEEAEDNNDDILFLEDFVMKHGSEFLGNAAWDNNTKVIEYIMENSQDQNINSGLSTARSQAVRNGSYEAFKMIQDRLNKNGNQNIHSNDYSDFLFHVIPGGSLDILKSIPDFINLLPSCVLDAIHVGNPEILGWLLDNGAELTSEHFLTAALNNETEMVKIILDKKDFDEETIKKAIVGASWRIPYNRLHFRNSQEDITHITGSTESPDPWVGVKEFGSDVIRYLINRTGIKAPKDSVIAVAGLNDTELLKFLFQHGGDDSDGEALYTSTCENAWESVIFLLENGSVFIKPDNDETQDPEHLIMEKLDVYSLPDSMLEIANMIKVKLVHQE